MLEIAVLYAVIFAGRKRKASISANIVLRKGNFMSNARPDVKSLVAKLRTAKDVVRLFPPPSGICAGCQETYIMRCPDCNGKNSKCRTCKGGGEIPCTVCHPIAKDNG